MELKLNPEKFEELQEIFIKEIIQTIRVKLVEGGLEGQKLEELTANIGSSIASIIDDTTPMEVEGTRVKPYLTFHGDDDDIIHCGENAYTYEYVMKILKEIFDV